MSGRTAVLGFRPHTYWTAAVALAGDVAAPEVLMRRRIDFASGDERGVYHHVEGMPGDEAQAWIDQVWAAVEANCRRGLGALLEELGKTGVTLGVAVVPIARNRPPDEAGGHPEDRTPGCTPPRGTSTAASWPRPAPNSAWRCAAPSSATSPPTSPAATPFPPARRKAT